MVETDHRFSGVATSRTGFAGATDAAADTADATATTADTADPTTTDAADGCAATNTDNAADSVGLVDELNSRAGDVKLE